MNARSRLLSSDECLDLFGKTAVDTKLLISIHSYERSAQTYGMRVEVYARELNSCSGVLMQANQSRSPFHKVSGSENDVTL